MRNLILRRGRGKTTRLLAISEFRDAPIICVNETHRRSILDMARRYGYYIPTPITASELLNGRLYGNNTYREYLVDESQDVLDVLVSGLTRAGQGCVVGMTTTDERRTIS